MLFFQSSLSAAKAIFKELTTKLIGHYILNIGQSQYNPSMYGSGIYSVWSVMANQENDYKQLMYSYNSLTKELIEAKEWGNSPLGDYHSQANVLVLPDNYILTVNDADHNTTFQVKRSASEMDVTSYELVTQITDGNPAYPTIDQFGTRIYNRYRSFPDEQLVQWSDDRGSTWTTAIPSFNIDDQPSDESWAYPKAIYSQDVPYFVVNERKGSGGSYKSLWIGKATSNTGSSLTIENFDETFSKNVSTLGAITRTEADTNYLISSTVGLVTGLCLDTNGNLMFSNTTTMYYRVKGGALTSQPLVNASYTSITTGAKSLIINTGLNSFEVFIVARRVTTNERWQIKVSTIDNFVTQEWEEITNIEKTTTPAANFNISQTGDSPLIYRKGVESGDNDPVDPLGAYGNIIFTESINNL